MTCKNSELREWLQSLGINLCDVTKDDDLLSAIAVDFCHQLGLDPNEVVVEGGTQCTRSTLYESQARSLLIMLRAIRNVLRREAGDLQ